MNVAADQLRGYYRLQSRIYDATRWSFLFGRDRILDEAAKVVQPRRILEVGCGTGTNLLELARRFPEARIEGIDLSEDMLEKARRKVESYGERVRLTHGAYGGNAGNGEPFDLILFSYCLTMVNPGYDALLRMALEDLAPAGAIAIVDFHDTPWGWFRRWMGINHVRFEGQILKAAEAMPLRLVHCRVAAAYLGVWRYLFCVAMR